MCNDGDEELRDCDDALYYLTITFDSSPIKGYFAKPTVILASRQYPQGWVNSRGCATHRHCGLDPQSRGEGPGRPSYWL